MANPSDAKMALDAADHLEMIGWANRAAAIRRLVKTKQWAPPAVREAKPRAWLTTYEGSDGFIITRDEAQARRFHAEDVSAGHRAYLFVAIEEPAAE